MDEKKLGAVETQFAEIIWQNAPLSSRRLVELCEERLQWKKSTTYTVLKKLCGRGIFENTDGTVTAKLSRAEFYSIQTEQFVEETFEGSLPAFIAAFTARRRLSENEISEIRRMIDSAGEETK